MNSKEQTVIDHKFLEEQMRLDRKISLTRVGLIDVSTVLLPRFSRDEPIQWETCLFDCSGTSRSEVVERYHSLKEAVGGHVIWCQRVEREGYDFDQNFWDGSLE